MTTDVIFVEALPLADLPLFRRPPGGPVPSLCAAAPSIALIAGQIAALKYCAVAVPYDPNICLLFNFNCRAARNGVSPGDIVVVDNLPAHQNPAVRKLIEAAGASCATCQPTRLTSTRSNRPLPN